jgi:predicted acyltransferase (DUF342 family)
MKFKLLNIMLVAPFLTVAASHASDPLVVEEASALNSSAAPLIFADTYVSVGASAELNGNVLATTYLVAGATTKATGHIQTGTAVTLGASTHVGGEINSDTAITLGASSKVFGRACFGTALTQGASSEYDEASCDGIVEMTYDRDLLLTEKEGLSDLAFPDGYNSAELESFVSQDIALNPTLDSISPATYNFNSVYLYDATSLTTGENVTITLERNQHFVFNITDMVSLGAGTQIKFADGTSTNTGTVTWNIGGYTSLGTDAKMEGKVLSSGYVSTGVRSEVCGGLFSADSYVTVGASAKVGTCTFD